jgi:cellobiose-specific phosphotransferase system component IIC
MLYLPFLLASSIFILLASIRGQNWDFVIQERLKVWKLIKKADLRLVQRGWQIPLYEY